MAVYRVQMFLVREAAAKMKAPRSMYLARRSLRLLDSRSRHLYVLAVLSQMAVSALDLLAVLLTGLVVTGAAVVTLGATSTPISGLIARLLPENSTQLVILAATAGVLLIGKSLTSLYLTRRTYKFLANRAALVSSNLARSLLQLPLLEIQRRPSQKITLALTTGVSAAIVNTLGPISMIFAEVALIVLLLSTLIAVDPFVALFTIAFFSFVFIVLHLSLGRWSVQLGKEYATAEIGSITEMQQAIRAYRELVVANRRDLFAIRFQSLRWRAASVVADTFILSQAGKYVFESALVLGAGGLVVILASTRTLESALLALTVFLLVSTRISPSLLRLQTALVQLRNSEGVASELFAMMPELQQVRAGIQTNSHFTSARSRSEFEPKVELYNASVTYPHASFQALTDITLIIQAGQSVAIVGPTGSGKSTLADVMLGVLQPTTGRAFLSGAPPGDALAMWPGSAAYVPQEVAVLNGTVRENVALGFPEEEIDDDAVWFALERSHLRQFLENSREGLDTAVGEHGFKLSGGQRQRLGIARALYTQPSLLVLDEATSALDAQTESDITATFESLSGETTVIVIAHRLATVQRCELVLNLDEGRLTASGSFSDVRKAVPEFERQAQLMGLN